jgi:putative redox protein
MSDSAYDPITITGDGGLRFAAQIRSHRLLVDQPVHADGGDAGPMPIELLGAALGTCVAHYVSQFCRARGLSCDGLRVEIEQHKGANPARIAEFRIRVVAPPSLPAEYLALLERVAQRCPAHATLTLGATIKVAVTGEAQQAITAC